MPGQDKELAAMQAVYAALSALTDDEKRRVLEWVQQKVGLGAAPPSPIVATKSLDSHLPGLRPAGGPRQFLASKRPQTDVERVTCLAYYLTHFRDLPEFKTKDITLLNREAGQPSLSNAAFAVANAARQNQFVAPTGGGRKQITIRGEALVEALPERERVREALEANPLVGRKRRKAVKKKRVGSG